MHSVCPFCGSAHPMKVIDFLQEGEVKGVKVGFSSPAYMCVICGHELMTPDQLDESIRASMQAYDRGNHA